MENFEMNNNQEFVGELNNTQETQEQVYPEYSAPVYPAEQIPAPTQVMEPVPEVKKPFDWVIFAKGVATGIATGVTAMKLGSATKKKIQEKQKTKGKWAIRSPFYRKAVHQENQEPAQETVVPENQTPENVQENKG